MDDSAKALRGDAVHLAIALHFAGVRALASSRVCLQFCTLAHQVCQPAETVLRLDVCLLFCW